MANREPDGKAIRTRWKVIRTSAGWNTQTSARETRRMVKVTSVVLIIASTDDDDNDVFSTIKMHPKRAACVRVLRLHGLTPRCRVS